MHARRRKEGPDSYDGRDAASLENFLVGDSNRVAHSACMAVASEPASAYNPLYLFGEPGTGKSHLLAGLGRLLDERHPTLRVESRTAQHFAESYIRAAKDDEFDEFRNWFRSADCLLVDAIEDLAKKRRSQIEFLQTITELLETHRQVVVTARQAPRRLEGFDPRLVSRFQGGLVAPLRAPDRDLCRQLIKAEAKAGSLRLTPSTLDFLTGHLPANARQLRGAIARLAAEYDDPGKPLTRQAAVRILSDVLPEDPATALEQIVRAVLRRYGLRLSQLQSKRRSRAVTLPRQICMFLAHELSSLSLVEIGAYFGGRDHTTVLHACRKIRQLSETDAAIARTLGDIRNGLQRPSG